MPPRFLGLILASVCCASEKSSYRGAVPCDDDDVERCLGYLSFVESVESREGQLADTLERYCVRNGSMKACRALAKLRRNRSLDNLCDEGVAEACAVPPAPKTPKELANECIGNRPQSCRELFSRAGSTDEVWRDTAVLEASCAEGIAKACFWLAESLKGRNEPDAAERANALAWRACVAGVTDACLISEKAVTRCVEGQATVCRQLRVLDSDSPQAKASKTRILSTACSRGEVESCFELQRIPGMTPKQRVELACEASRSCTGAHLADLSVDDLRTYCDSDHRIKYRACGELLSTRRNLTEVEGPKVVVEKRCHEGDLESCEALVSWFRANHRGFEGVRLACDKIARCPEKLTDLIEKLQACTARAEPAPCLAAGVAAKDDDSIGDDPVVLQALSIACNGGEAAGCLQAADSLQDSPEVSRLLEVLKKGCKLKSAQACTDAAPLEAEERACKAGRCQAWANRHLRRNPGSLPALKWLEDSCRKGDAASCESWRSEMADRISLRLERCASVPNLCSKADLRARAFRGQCEAGSARDCLELLRFLEAEGQSQSLRNEPDALKWATTACSAGMMNGCEFQAGLSKDQAASMPVGEKACTLGSGFWCGAVARYTWQQVEKLEPSSQSGAEAKKALTLAIKSCDLQNEEGCALAAEFLEQGIGAPKDPAAAERLRQKARDLHASQQQRSP